MQVLEGLRYKNCNTVQQARKIHKHRPENLVTETRKYNHSLDTLPSQKDPTEARIFFACTFVLSNRTSN